LSKKPMMTREGARAWKARWKLVNDFERAELRMTPPSVKLRQFLALLAMAKQFGWTESLAEGEGEVRERWQKLRKAYGV
jgi:hypothetical protein